MKKEEVGSEFSQPFTRIHAGYFAYTKILQGSVHLHILEDFGI